MDFNDDQFLMYPPPRPRHRRVLGEVVMEPDPGQRSATAFAPPLETHIKVIIPIEQESTDTEE